MRSTAHALCLGALLLSACGRGGGRHEIAAAALRSGNLEGVESALAGDSSPAAESLRAAARERRAGREALDRRLAEIERDLAPAEAFAALEELAREAADPVARERIQSAQSRAYDQRASGVHDRSRAQTAQTARAEQPAVPLAPRASAEPTADVVLDAARASIRARVEARDWMRALAEVDMTLEHAGARAGELGALRRELLNLAASDMEDLLHGVVRIERDSGLEAAHAHLAREAWRFPASGRFEELPRELRDLEGRLEIWRMSAVSDDELDASALAAASDGGALIDDLAAEIERCLAAARAERPGAGRDAHVVRARELERRLELRREIAAARAADAAGFAALGIDAADERELTVAGARIVWDALDLDRLTRAARRARLSQEAEIGLVIERVLRGDRGGPNGALAELERLRERGAITEAEAWDLVARARKESLPAGGYVFERGEWVVASEHERAARAAELAALEAKLVDADANAREAAYQALAQLGESAVPALARAVAARRADAVSELSRGATLDQLERLAEQRRALDLRREEALELIFDEERYFYPYNPPEVDPSKAAQYWPVQTRVDELVARVRESWEGARRVKLPAGFRAALGELAWTAQCATAAEAAPSDSTPGDPAPSNASELPAWLEGIDPRLPEIGLAEFAWSSAERTQLAADRAVAARNERMWESEKGYDAEQLAGQGEREQVRVTNEYRRMFGRRVLAWNPRIQAGARMHSRYMSDTGDFGHFEPDPQRRTPGDRMRLAGYEHGVSENCHMGGSGPQGAHDGWTHSSGHHRNLLSAGHREMASAQVSSYWTQNFGVDTSFLSELAE